MKSFSLIVLSLVTISSAQSQFNQFPQGGGFPNQGFVNPQLQNQQGFPNMIGNQNPFFPGNLGFGFNEGNQQGFNRPQTDFGNQQQGFGALPAFGSQQQSGFGSQQSQQQEQRPGFGGQQTGVGGQQGFSSQQQQQPGSQQGLNNNNQGFNQNQQPLTTIAPGTSIVGTPQFVLCNQNCPSVNQYNPICGSDQITYNNQYRLDCANDCGRQLDPNWQEITIFSRRNCVSGSRVA